MRNLIAILRGIKPEEAIDITAVLIEQGFAQIEIPLNSPSPFVSIERIANRFGEQTLIGAGTVLSPDQVSELNDAGGRLAVSPDCNPAVIEAACRYGMTSIPGVLTTTECFTALRHGANLLKIFPAFVLGENGLRAIRAVLPPGTKMLAVGGVGPDNFTSWLGAGIHGFGIGSALYRPGDSAQAVADKAKTIVTAYDYAITA